MRVCLFDPFGGISGDMALAALVDAGCAVSHLQDLLHTLDIPRVKLRITQTHKKSLRALAVTIEGAPRFRIKHTHQVMDVIERSALSARAKERAAAVFSALGSAEARAHGVEPGQEHLHEVGSLDSLVDIIGNAAATDLLNLEQFYSAPLPYPQGSVLAEHGLIPLPAPATLELLKGVPTRPQDFDGETVTPTGAAILAGLGCRFDPPPMKIVATGCGAGAADFPVANILRVVIGEAPNPCFFKETERVAVIEATIDDMNPQLYQPLCEKLLTDGALEVFLTPVQMKKFRPGTLVTALAEVADRERIAAALLAHSTTIGCRTRLEERYCLPRQIVDVETSLGIIRVKVIEAGKTRRAAPEFEDVRKLAKSLGRSLPEVLAQIQAELAQLML